jgi:hypothetical protein
MSPRSDSFERAYWQALDDIREGAARPIETYLVLVRREERDELALMLSDLLLARGAAPTPSKEESEGYQRAIAAIDAVLGERKQAGILPGALLTMRRTRGIEAEAVVEALADDFEIQGDSGRKALERNYHRLETGKLLGKKLSRRLLESLAQVFDVDPRDLIAGARVSGPAAPMKPAPGLGRPSGSSAVARPSPSGPSVGAVDPEVDIVERLFLGGPDA